VGSTSPALDLVGRVLREQGLGHHIDADFIEAATKEMQEAMNMTPAEFEAAAAQLLQAESEGTFRRFLGHMENNGKPQSPKIKASAPKL